MIAHAGHHFESWINEIGVYHLAVLHFPIALVIMTAVAELLSSRKKASLILQPAARFMILWAAITVIPTVLLGFMLNYDEKLADVYWWHRFFGLTTATLAILTCVFKECGVRGKSKKWPYAVLLTLLVISVLTTGALGHLLTFQHVP